MCIHCANAGHIMADKISLHVKPTAGGDKIVLPEVELSLLVSELKEEVAKHSPIQASEQRLIFKGQILKDERTLESYGGFLLHSPTKGRNYVMHTHSNRAHPPGIACTHDACDQHNRAYPCFRRHHE